MDPTYTDQVEQLDIRKLMAQLIKAARSNRYALTIPMENWSPVEADPDGDLLGIEIVLDRSSNVPADAPLVGNMLLKFTLPDGGKREQILLLEGVPATKASWRWKAICPCSDERVHTLYFKDSLRQFVSLKAAGLKYRAKPPRENCRHLERVRSILTELEAKNLGPYIPKPGWMTEARYEELLREFDKACLRANPLLGLRVEFHNEHKIPDPDARLERLPAKEP
jgi:hypothetical protein